MENSPETPSDKKVMSKAKSYINTPPFKLKSESVKRKNFNENEAVRSLDLALVRLKKSKLVSGECSANRNQGGSARKSVTSADMYMDLASNSNIYSGFNNSSLMSMNFSHYELMRNLSRSTSTSEGAFSGTTCNTYLPADSTIKDEHLERYFRSAELWSRKCRERPNSVQFDIPEN